jgi:succinoglycan biosynthesis transport protein ExoP
VEPSRLVSILRRSWLLLVVAALAGGSLGAWISSQGSPEYEATTTLLVGPINTDSETLQAAGRLARTYAELANSRATLESATEDLDLEDVGRAEISSSASDVTRLLTIKVRHPDRDVAASIANALGEELETLATEGTGGSGLEGQLLVIERASPSSGAVPRKAELVAVLWALAAVVVVAAILLLLELLSPTVRSAHDLGEVVDVPLLATVPAPGRFVSPRRRRLARARAVAFRMAATALELGRADRATTRTVVVLGVSEEDGAADTARSLAEAFGDLGLRVAFADADSEGRTAARPPAQIDTTPGVHDVELGVVPATHGQQATEAAAGRLLELLTDTDVVVVHSSAPTSSTSSLVWAEVSDGVVLIVRERHTRRTDVLDTVSILRRVGARPAGIILDRAPAPTRTTTGPAPALQRAVRPRRPPMPTSAPATTTPTPGQASTAVASPPAPAVPPPSPERVPASPEPTPPAVEAPAPPPPAGWNGQRSSTEPAEPAVPAEPMPPPAPPAEAPADEVQTWPWEASSAPAGPAAPAPKERPGRKKVDEEERQRDARAARRRRMKARKRKRKS